jgi:hypothetical protein
MKCPKCGYNNTLLDPIIEDWCKMKKLEKVLEAARVTVKVLDELIPKISCDDAYSTECTACRLLDVKHKCEQAIKEAGE